MRSDKITKEYDIMRNETLVSDPKEDKLLRKSFIVEIRPEIPLQEGQKNLVKERGFENTTVSEEVKDVFFTFLFTFLESPTVLDVFREDRERRDVRNKMFDEDRELFDYWEKNKLRGGVLAKFPLLFQIIEMEGGHIPISDEDKNFILNFKTGVYKKYSLVEKISCVENFTRICSDLFKTFLESN